MGCSTQTNKYSSVADEKNYGILNYNFKDIETKWQNNWIKSNSFKSKTDQNQKKLVNTLLMS